MENESRIFKICNSISTFKLFDRIEIIGKIKDNLKETESLNDNVFIKRFGTKKLNFLYLNKLAAYFWYLQIIVYLLRTKPQCINIHSVSLAPIRR